LQDGVADTLASDFFDQDFRWHIALKEGDKGEYGAEGGVDACGNDDGLSLPSLNDYAKKEDGETDLQSNCGEYVYARQGNAVLWMTC
jgi:hypothetical protein